MELRFRTDLGGIDLIETELEAQNPPHWLCLHCHPSCNPHDPEDSKDKFRNHCTKKFENISEDLKKG